MKLREVDLIWPKIEKLSSDEKKELIRKLCERLHLPYPECLAHRGEDKSWPLVSQEK